MSRQDRFAGYAAALAFALASSTIAAAHAEDHWTTYQTGVSSPAEQAAAAARFARSTQQARLRGPAASDATELQGQGDALGSGGPLDEIYKQLYQPGRAGSTYNTK